MSTIKTKLMLNSSSVFCLCYMFLLPLLSEEELFSPSVSFCSVCRATRKGQPDRKSVV